jgi:hypothetical protein
MRTERTTLYQLICKQGFLDIIPLIPFLVLKHPMHRLNHSVSIHMLILLLQIREHCSKHETTYIERKIASLLLSYAIYSTRTSSEVLRVRFCKNILDFLLPENNCQVALPIHRISSIELFLLKQGLQVKSGCATSRNHPQEEIKSIVLALSYVPIFYKTIS